MSKKSLYRINVLVSESKTPLFLRVMSQFDIPKKELSIKSDKYDINQRSYEFVFNIKSRTEKDRVLDTCLLSDGILYGCTNVLS